MFCKDQPSVLDGDRLGVQILVECLLAEVFPEARLLAAAKGRGDVGFVVSVDKDRASLSTPKEFGHKAVDPNAHRSEGDRKQSPIGHGAKINPPVGTSG